MWSRRMSATDALTVVRQGNSGSFHLLLFVPLTKCLLHSLNGFYSAGADLAQPELPRATRGVRSLPLRTAPERRRVSQMAHPT